MCIYLNVIQKVSEGFITSCNCFVTVKTELQRANKGTTGCPLIMYVPDYVRTLAPETERPSLIKIKYIHLYQLQITCNV